MEPMNQTICKKSFTSIGSATKWEYLYFFENETYNFLKLGIHYRIYNKDNYIDMDSDYEFEKYFTTIKEHRKLKLEKLSNGI